DMRWATHYGGSTPASAKALPILLMAWIMRSRSVPSSEVSVRMLAWVPLNRLARRASASACLGLRISWTAMVGDSSGSISGDRAFGKSGRRDVSWMSLLMFQRYSVCFQCDRDGPSALQPGPRASGYRRGSCGDLHEGAIVRAQYP